MLSGPEVIDVYYWLQFLVERQEYLEFKRIIDCLGSDSISDVRIHISRLQAREGRVSPRLTRRH